MTRPVLVSIIGGATLVDRDDVALAMRYPWRVTPDGYATAYVAPYTTTSLHRMIAETPAGLVTDHINGETLDNRRANLRHATHSENARNTRASRATAHP